MPNWKHFMLSGMEFTDRTDPSFCHWTKWSASSSAPSEWHPSFSWGFIGQLGEFTCFTTLKLLTWDISFWFQMISIKSKPFHTWGNGACRNSWRTRRWLAGCSTQVPAAPRARSHLGLRFWLSKKIVWICLLNAWGKILPANTPSCASLGVRKR